MALANIDDMIELIKTSSNRDEAKTGLLARTWQAGLVPNYAGTGRWRNAFPTGRPGRWNLAFMTASYRLSETQAQAILDLRLHRLTGLEQDKIVQEYKQLLEED